MSEVQNAQVMKVHVRATAYEVSVFGDDIREDPDFALDASTWVVTVEYRGQRKWAVLFNSMCLGSDGEWDWEPSPSNRTDAWLKTHRFSKGHALQLAAEHAPKVRLNGWTAEDLLLDKLAKRRQP